MKLFQFSLGLVISSILVALATSSCDCGGPDFKTDLDQLPQLPNQLPGMPPGGGAPGGPNDPLSSNDPKLGDPPKQGPHSGGGKKGGTQNNDNTEEDLDDVDPTDKDGTGDNKNPKKNNKKDPKKKKGEGPNQGENPGGGKPSDVPRTGPETSGNEKSTTDDKDDKQEQNHNNNGGPQPGLPGGPKPGPKPPADSKAPKEKRTKTLVAGEVVGLIQEMMDQAPSNPIYQDYIEKLEKNLEVKNGDSPFYPLSKFQKSNASEEIKAHISDMHILITALGKAKDQFIDENEHHTGSDGNLTLKHKGAFALSRFRTKIDTTIGRIKELQDKNLPDN